MSYRRSLLTRWSTRDRLAVLVVGLTVAFLTGTVVLFTGASAQVVSIATDYGTGGSVEYVDSVDSTDDAVYLLSTTATAQGESESTRVVALTDAVQLPTQAGPSRLAPVERGATVEGVDRTTTQRLRGSDGAVTLQLEPRDRGAIPGNWYAANGSTVRQLGPVDAFRITTTSNETTEIPAHGSPLRGALAFFLIGSGQLLTVLRLLAVAAGVLAAVTVFSVTKMSVQDRYRTIRVARSTGAPPHHLLAVFAARGGALALVGAALGYALGVVIPNLAVNVAVFVGLPTSLTASVSPAALSVLLPSYVGIVLVGTVAGGLASLAAVRVPPSSLTDHQSGTRRQGAETDGGSSLGGLRTRLEPTLLGWRPLVPTTASITVFVLIAVLLASGAGAMAPLVSGEGQTITQPGSSHPINSNVPESYAEALDSEDIDASPELLAFSVVDGEAFLTRGVDYSAFSSVTETDIVAGREPDGRHEAVVGVGLAERLDIAPGDSLTLGGSTHARLTRVEVVGVVDAPGAYDDQLLVSLATGQHLTGKGPDSVQFIRTTGLDQSTTTNPVRIVDVEAPKQVVAGEPVTVTATVVNLGPEQTTTISSRFGEDTQGQSVTLRSFEQKRVAFEFTAPEEGPATVSVGERETELQVVSPSALTLRGVPDRVPPESRPRVQVVTAAGDPVPNATVTVGGNTASTTADGWVRLPIGDTGNATVEVRKGARSVSREISVMSSAERRPVVSLSVSPDSPSVLSTPRIRATLYNPWNRTLTPTVTLAAADDDTTQSVSLDPGARATVDLELGHLAPGNYTASVQTRAGSLEERSFTVVGDSRLAAALATSGSQSGSSGIGQAISTVFGNLQLVVGTLVGLAGVMVVGSVSAAFASAVHARRRTLGIFRATGATPFRVQRLVLADAVRLGGVAAILGVALGVALARVLEQAGLLTIYGIRLSIQPSLALIGGLAIASVGLVALGAWLATRSVVASAPATLLTGAEGAWSPDE